MARVCNACPNHTIQDVALSGLLRAAPFFDGRCPSFVYHALSGLGSVLGTASQGYHPILKDNALSGLHLSLRSPRSPEKTG